MKKIVILNHKMFLTKDEAKLLKTKMDNLEYNNLDLIVCPSYINIDVFNNYDIAAQDCFYEDTGAYTGFISSYQLSLLGVKYSLVGHSERRLFDTDNIINKKIKSLLKNCMVPILCIGDTKEEKEMMKTSEVLKRQLKKALMGINFSSLDNIIIAYEPSFLIGGKNTLKKEEINEIILYIKKLLIDFKVPNFKVVYGASIDNKTINNIKDCDVDGFLIGSSSANYEELKEIIKCINSVK